VASGFCVSFFLDCIMNVSLTARSGVLAVTKTPAWGSQAPLLFADLRLN
jgi:hypothetical protein